MLLGGLWHGASWNFVVWGALHGCGLAVNRFCSGRGLRTGPLVGTLATLSFVMLCWVPFRAPSLGSARVMLEAMFGRGTGVARWYPTAVIWGLVLVALGHALGYAIRRAPAATEGRRPIHALLAWFDATIGEDPLAGRYVRLGMGSFGGSFLVTTWILALFFFVRTRTTPFIDFQF
jgi:hypothetical protein